MTCWYANDYWNLVLWAWCYSHLAQSNDVPQYSLTLSLVTTCFLQLKMPVFVALKASVPRPANLSTTTLLTLLTPLRTSVNTYLASQTKKLSLQRVPHSTPFNGIISHLCLCCFVFLYLLTYFFISCLVLYKWLQLNKLKWPTKRWDDGWKLGFRSQTTDYQ